MILAMSLVTEEETRAGRVRHAAWEAAAAAASHLRLDAGFSSQQRAQRQATAVAERALFGVCRNVNVELFPQVGWGPWRERQVAVRVVCEPGDPEQRSGHGLAWVGPR